jgi:type I restriction enzyme M protein
VPAHCSWQHLLDADGDELELTYRHILEDLARQPGVLGVIFRKAQNRIQDPAKLKRLVVDLIDKENWSASGTDIKGDAYESLLAKGAEDIKSGAGQYFTPRPLIQAMVDVLQPTARDTVMDPAAGTGGFLLVAHEYAARHAKDLTPEERDHLRDGFVHGVELVDGTARLAAMNLLLHGIGRAYGESLIEVKDALLADPGRRYSIVLSNPPFGRKSSLTMVGADGREAREDREIERQDFVVTTANKQLNFLQHIATILAMSGRAAVVLPDNVLFEGGAGETIRRRVSRPTCCSSTSDRPPTTPGPSGCGSTTCASTSTSPSSRTRCAEPTSTTSSRPSGRGVPAPSGRRASASGPSRTRSSLRATRRTSTLTWLKDASLEDVDDLPAPEVIAREIVDDLTAALAEFEAVAAALEGAGAADPA